MGRRANNSDRGVLLTAEAVQRIAAAVQHYEHGKRSQPAIKLRTAWDDGGELMKLCYTDTAIPRNAAGVTVKVWKKSVDAPTSESGCAVENWDESTDELCVTNYLFDIGANCFFWAGRVDTSGLWYIISSASWKVVEIDRGATIGGEDLTTLANYDATKTQILGHVSGELQWIDTTTCGEV